MQTGETGRVRHQIRGDMSGKTTDMEKQFWRETFFQITDMEKVFGSDHHGAIFSNDVEFSKNW